MRGANGSIVVVDVCVGKGLGSDGTVAGVGSSVGRTSGSVGDAVGADVGSNGRVPGTHVNVVLA